LDFGESVRSDGQEGGTRSDEEMALVREDDGASKMMTLGLMVSYMNASGSYTCNVFIMTLR
jgi:hypothetical protein